MREIIKNQIWKRKRFDHPYFPPKGWEVRIVDVIEREGIVVHEVFVYDGKLTSPKERTAVPQDIETFLRLYEQ